jgi:hypothetical protein
MAQKKAVPTKVGRPRQYEDGAAKLRAFRAKAAYPGKRYDIYLGKDAHIAVSVQMKRYPSLSASRVIEAMLCCAHNVPPRELAKWFPET